MYSIDFPKMFNSASTRLVKDSSATVQNIRLLLESSRGSLLGDPYFGSKVHKYIYEQNNVILRDIIIDDILVALQTFIPQIKVTRDDIKLVSDKSAIYADISCINKIDSTTNLFQIKLTTD
jgi:phage baseplate assembly protein W